MPEISIITPIYNSQRFLAQTIESVLAQTFSDWELRLIDDGSKDGSATVGQEFARRDPRICFVSQANSGVVASRNRGLAEAHPDSRYIIFLDHDDVWEPDALEQLRRGLEANPDAVAAHGWSRYLDVNGEPCLFEGEMEYHKKRIGAVNGRIVAMPEDAPTTFAIEAISNCIATPGQTLLRRDILNRVGPLCVECNPCDDWEMYLRITQIGPIALVNRTVIGWRQHENNVSRDGSKMANRMEFVRARIFAMPSLTPENRHILILGYRLFQQKSYRRRLELMREDLRRRDMKQAAQNFRYALTNFARSRFGTPEKPHG